MNKEIKFLMDKLIEKHGGSFKKINQRTFWEAPTGDHYHVTTVFLRRMAVKPPTKEATAIASQVIIMMFPARRSHSHQYNLADVADVQQR